MKTSARKRIVNFLGFQVLWWTLFFGATSGTWLPSLLCLIAFFAIHFLWVCGPRWREEFFYILVLGTAGWAVDGFWNTVEVLQFKSLVHWAPVWLLCMWWAFAATVRHALAPLLRRPVLSAVLGALIAPIVYGFGIPAGLYGAPNGIVNFAVVIGFFWGTLMFALSLLSRKVFATESREDELTTLP
jgi:hypothetical protein